MMNGAGELERLSASTPNLFVASHAPKYAQTSVTRTNRVRNEKRGRQHVIFMDTLLFLLVLL